MIAITTGRRRIALLIIALVFCFYGVGILVGYEPTFATAFHLNIRVFGWGWVVVGLATITGLIIRNDKWHFSLAAAWSGFWGLLLTTHWTQPHGWASGLSWMGVCLFILLISFWPERSLLLDNLELEARIKRLEQALITAGIELPVADKKEDLYDSSVSSGCKTQ